MRHQIVYITGFEDWEMLYVDKVEILQGHRIYPIEILEQIALLENDFQITVYEWLHEVLPENGFNYVNSPDFNTLSKHLENPNLFEKSVLKVL